MTSPLPLSGRLPGRFVTPALLLISFLALSACDSSATKVSSIDPIGTDTTADTLAITQDITTTSIVCIDTAPVGDGWGWDGSAPCRIVSEDSPTVLPQGTNVLCVDTPPLGDGWGWNGWAACQLNGDEVTGSNQPLSEQTAVEEIAVEEIAVADTPLSNENTITTADIEQVAPFDARDITDLILVTGQSNALGADAGFNPALDAPNERVFAFTDQGWRVANLDQVWDLGRYPRNAVNTIPSNNFGLHFGKRMATRLNDRVIGIVLITAPGEAISHWDSSGGFFAQTRDKVSRALNELPHKSKVDGILWHQGESDGRDRDEYSEALFELINDFRSEPWFEFELPFICGETASSPVNLQLQKLNQDNDPWTACIRAEGLPTLGDNSHFNAEALRTIGRRYADQYIEMRSGN